MKLVLTSSSCEGLKPYRSTELKTSRHKGDFILYPYSIIIQMSKQVCTSNACILLQYYTIDPNCKFQLNVHTNMHVYQCEVLYVRMSKWIATLNENVIRMSLVQSTQSDISNPAQKWSLDNNKIADHSGCDRLWSYKGQMLQKTAQERHNIRILLLPWLQLKFGCVCTRWMAAMHDALPR